ncbi:histone-like transcription factor domain containing protein [Babesia ovata]|uniref:Histone-like transcription factor domain containing protein n=1 Tax=Babesia ovata TaxID=189622 RepID=A0A2H6KI90_9APIC|nr:histone-like transcription factor domain containing protein [Babesia ovata]GBE62707.1 histone-like transcription factor domain containing protein [Babesia ovata]
MMGYGAISGDSYAYANSGDHLIAASGGKGSEGPNPRDVTSISDNVSGNRYVHTDPMLAARSYEELLISASKAPGEAYENTIKSGYPPDVPERRDVLTSGFTEVPVEYVQGPQAHEAIDARPVNNDAELTDNASKAIVSQPYTSDAPLQYSAQGLDTTRAEGTLMVPFSKGESTSRGSTSTSRPAASFGNETQSSFPYEPTAYVGHSGVEYDTVSQGDMSFERREGDYETALPIANVSRLMKSVLPGTAKIAKQAKDVIRECVTEFILFVSSEASDICTKERRKILSADDIFLAMNSLGFGHYNDPLRSYQAMIKEREQAAMLDF